MQIEIIREDDEFRVSAFSAETPLVEVMEDVYESHRGRGLKPVTEVRRVDLNGRVVERLTASRYAAMLEAKQH